ncbi:dienelactone hydrolase family protein [Desulfovibrio sp.]|uniref:dienelactone hydrolase family protein n=1 Tax=Desulfovibrio sp. TaxID=885 RepID=UPI0025C28130|nr:dienelactone hydrolase family protein [Desulfovibrio sp.]
MNKISLAIVSAFLIFAASSAVAAERQTFVTGLRNPVGMLYDPEGRLYIADWGTQTVSRYDEKARQSVITQEVGRPSGLALDENGTLYIASYNRNVIYTLKPGQEPRVFATGFNTPAGLLWDDGVLYMANRDAGEIIRIFPNGQKEVISRGHIQPVGIVKRADGSLVISCLGGTVEQIGVDGSIRVISDKLNSPSPGLIPDGDNAVLVPDYGGTIVGRIYMDGRTEAVAQGFITPVGLVRMPDGRLMVGDWGRGVSVILNDVESSLPPKNETGSLNEPMRFAHLKPDNTIRDLLEHPAFSGFAQNLLARDSDQRQTHITLRHTSKLMPYHSNVDTGTVVNALNTMIDSAGAGNRVFYDFYTEQQKRDDPAKNATGLFFFRGKPGAPFAVICPGGGFSYVGSFQEGFPHAMELSQKGYNAFVLKYRVGGGGMPATQDLAAALSYLFKNADSLKISKTGYSLWGSSAGARMVAYIGSHGTARFGGKQLPLPSALVMAYTGHTEFTPNDPPTFSIVSADDPIVRASNVENRITEMREAGIDVELRKYKNAGHGFGLGIGTDAQGWMEHAIRFWEKHLPDDSRVGGGS